MANVGGVGGLYGLNPSGGAATLLGALTLAGSPLSVSGYAGLASSPGGQTFGLFTVAGEVGLYEVADDGAATFRGNPTLAGAPVGGSLADLAFTSDGTLYTALTVGQSQFLLSVNPVDAALTLVGGIDTNVGEPLTGLAVIPAPGAGALVVGGVAVVGRRRR